MISIKPAKLAKAVGSWLKSKDGVSAYGITVGATMPIIVIKLTDTPYVEAIALVIGGAIAICSIFHKSRSSDSPDPNNPGGHTERDRKQATKMEGNVNANAKKKSKKYRKPKDVYEMLDNQLMAGQLNISNKTCAFMEDQANNRIDFMLIKKSDEISNLVSVLHRTFEINGKVNYKENSNKCFDYKGHSLSKNEIENIPSLIMDENKNNRRKDKIDLAGNFKDNHN